ncbi:glycosyltransferase family 4 protein [Confluentibacter flavum]|uniref:Glycosyltransferase n=1 Tax=Confluentibacter flavum TaxID=1909700 RepID=A0A2N3HP32_9FLAO|nr:glycosyltransferase family 4 protein [Confluentibacter flavum]PKQ46743.1 glycosyltransferase [Confluentibacter flavum]
MINTPKSVLIVTSEFPPQPGGIGNHAYQLAKHLSVLGFDVTVIADQRSGGQEDFCFDKTLGFDVQRIKLHRFRILMYMHRFVVVLKTITHHELVIATGKFPLWLVSFYSLFFKRHYLAVIHGSEVNFRHRLFRFITDCSLKRFHRVIAVSRYTQSLVAHLGLKTVTVIPNAIDPYDWDLNAKESMGLKGFPKLLTVGQLSNRKGQLEVIKHLPKLISVYPEIHYHCVGIATESSRFMAVAAQLGVTAYVTFHGLKTQAELKAFYQSSDIFVMLSHPTKSGDVEGFGIAILEANYFGLPAIGATGSGIADAIVDGDSGLLIAYEDSSAFISAVQTLLKDRDGFEIRAKAWARQHEWAWIVKRYVEVIESLI